VRRSDRVGLFIPASVDQVALLFAAVKIGAIAVPVSARFKQHELRQVVRHSGMRLLVLRENRPGEPDLPALLFSAFGLHADELDECLDVAGAPELERVLLLPAEPAPPDPAGRGNDDAQSDIEVDRRQEAVRLRDTALLVYTSGTSAEPKGAMLSHEAFARLADSIAHVRVGLTLNDRLWSAVPLFHAGGLTFLFTCLTAGCTYVHAGHFEPAATPAYLVAERITVVFAAFETIWLPGAQPARVRRPGPEFGARADGSRRARAAAAHVGAAAEGDPDLVRRHDRGGGLPRPQQAGRPVREAHDHRWPLRCPR